MEFAKNLAQSSGNSSGYATGGDDARKLGVIMGGQNSQILGIVSLIMIVLGWFSVSVEVFLRHSFGERYLSPLRLFLALLTLSFFATGGQLLSIFSGAVGGTEGSMIRGLGGVLMFQFLYWGYMIMSAWHLWQISKRNKRGERWHSWSFGVSRFNFLAGRKFGPLFIDDWTLYRTVEPGFVLLLAIIFIFISGAAAFWLFLASVTMFVKNNYIYGQARGQMLDLVDSQIEGEYFQSALQGTDKRRTAGFSMVRTPLAIDRNRDGIPDPLQSSMVDFSGTVQRTLNEQPPASGSTGDAAPVGVMDFSSTVQAAIGSMVLDNEEIKETTMVNKDVA